MLEKKVIKSQTFTDTTNSEIRRAAKTGIYNIRGGGAKSVYHILMISYFWEHQFPDIL